MALTRKFLASKGIEADVIDEIIAAHTETVSALKDEVDKLEKYKHDSAKLKEVQKELDELKSKQGETEDADSKLAALQKEFDDYKADIERKQTREAKETAYKEILKDAGIPEKHFAKILKYSDVDGIELTKEGKAKSASEILKTVKEEWSDHVETTETVGAKTSTPPTDGKGEQKYDTSAALKRVAQFNAERYGTVAEKKEGQ